MNTRLYALSSDTLASTTGIDIFESGNTNLTLSLSGIEQSAYHYIKFVVDFDDGSPLQIIQNTTDVKQLSSKTVSHVFRPTDRYITTYNIRLSGHRIDGDMDIYPINFNVGKNSVTDYKSIKIIEAQLFTTPAGENNIMLTIEAENPRYVGNLIIPYDPSISIYDELDLLPTIDLTDFYLRTEIYTGVGGEYAIIGEHTGAYFIRESDLIVFVIGNQLVSKWSGETELRQLFGGLVESIAICGEEHTYGSHTITDINGNTITPELLLVPEVSFDESATVAIDDLTYTAKPADQNLPYIHSGLEDK